jgi:hypothetical protein
VENFRLLGCDSDLPGRQDRTGQGDNMKEHFFGLTWSWIGEEINEHSSLFIFIPRFHPPAGSSINSCGFICALGVEREKGFCQVILMFEQVLSFQRERSRARLNLST